MPAGGLGVGPVGGVAEPSGGDLRKRRLPAEDTEEAGEDQSTGQRGKRHRRTNQAIVPEWVTEAHTHLLSRTEDVVWQELVELWHGFEVSYSRMGGAGMANLAASMRPAELNKWVKTRQFSSIPEITDIQQFGRDWSAWWAQLTTKKGSKTGEEDLRGVKKAGPLGVVVAVIGLGWWCDGGEEWKAAVVKARAVLKQFGTRS
ncbi:hypothetical protein DFP72DRAFT_799545 [Ephemerocybe angulata]|uniref:Uncharacterized protein n=1 Tax=Ephemerocybe angulata TaxID=980116 RepID=A0A8H6IFJ5_9AGAR|nr:hypothetical protein DFP72DRAFT_799545 [Tulosesus angulatus]